MWEGFGKYVLECYKKNAKSIVVKADGLVCDLKTAKAICAVNAHLDKTIVPEEEGHREMSKRSGRPARFISDENRRCLALSSTSLIPHQDVQEYTIVGCPHGEDGVNVVKYAVMALQSHTVMSFALQNMVAFNAQITTNLFVKDLAILEVAIAM